LLTFLKCINRRRIAMKSYQHLRHLALSAACLFCGLWLSTAQPVPPTSSTSQFNGSQSNGNQSSGSQSTATLQGAAALDQLKQTGQFTSLQAAMQQARRSVSHADKTPLGRPAWYAPNRAAGYDAYVHEEGVSLVLGDASQVGLRLAGLGYGTDLHDVAAGVVSGEQQMINIERGTVREWYVNGAEGLEQGFTLNERPPSAIRHPPSAIPLRLALQVSAGWRAVPGADDQRVGLLNDAGAMLEYGKLAAWDAQGQTLPAALTVEGESIVIEVDDAQAVYPLTIDPIFTQQAKLSAPDAAANDGFGSAVALSGNTALISAPFDDVTFVDQGSAYVFVRSGSAWTFQAKLTATDGANSDRLGVSVALSGDTAVLGAAAKNAVYVFTRNGTSWSQQQKLTGNDGGFGVAVALSGESVIIGANFESISGFQTGAAYVFTRSGTTWTQQQKLTASDGAQGDNFGSAVALDGAVALVAASGDDIGAINNQGSVYVFARSGTVWTPQQKLLASDGAADDSFGFSVALSGDTAAVGAYLDDSGANINQGAAYIFTRVGTTWTQQQKLTASDGAANDFLGYSLALSGDVLIASALGDGFGATSGQGSLYVFARSGTTWTQQNKLFAADGVNGDNLGRAVALSGDTVLVGAAEDDGAFTNQGAAYVFALCNNNFVQQQKVFASDGAADDIFGYSIALSSDTLLVSAPRDDAGTVIDQGSAYVFLRNGTNWAFQQKLTFGNGFGGTYFGISVALDGETAVIGTNYDITQTNPSVAYVFTRNGANWSLQQTLTANDATAHSGFGGAVALRGDTIVVGAYNVSVGMQTGVGAAYVFTRSGGSWSQQQKLLANDGAQGDGFGRGVALSGDSLLVGAIRGDTPTQPNTGVAYVFTRSGASWSQQQKLFATDVAAGNNFGVDVALSGDSALVSTSVGTAYVFTRSDTNWTQQRKFGPFGGRLSIALSGDTAALGGNNEVKVFTRAGTVWTELPPLTASDEVAGNNFGESVALSGDTLAVGAISDDIGANVDQGSAYVFTCTACPAVTLNLASLPNAHVGTSYNQALTASGGTGPYQFSLSSGALPPGVELASSGLLFGTPTTTGTYSFTVTATILSSLCPGSRTYTLTVTPPCPTITVNPNNPTLLNGRAGVPYSQTFTQTGGTRHHVSIRRPCRMALSAPRITKP
jgi:hypothetical protein